VYELIPKIIIAYILLYSSTIIHEFSHKRKAKKFKVRIKTKKTSRFSIIFRGIELKFPLGGYIDLNDKDLKKLRVNERSEIFMAGIKSRLFFCTFFLFLSILSTFWFRKWTFSLLIVVLGCLGFLLKNIFGKNGDFQKLISFP